MAYGDPGNAGSVQSGNPGEQKTGGIAGLLGFKTQKARGPNAAAYNAERDAASEAAQTYGGLSTDYTQQAPTISNQFQDQSRSAIGGNVNAQQNLASMLMNNNGAASRAQFQSGLDQSIDSQMAMANSAPGGAAAHAGAARAAAQQGALMQAKGASEAARLGALEREAALGQAAGVYGNIGNQLQGQYGLEQQSAMHQADLQSVNQAQQNQMRLGYGQLGQGARGQSLNALNSYTSADMGAQGLSAGLAASKGTAIDKLIGMGASIVGQGAGALGGALGGGGGGGGGAAASGGGGGSGDGPLGGLQQYSYENYPAAARGGAIGAAPNSIASLYRADIPAEAPAPRSASLAEALAGVEALRAKLVGHARALGGFVGAGSGPGQASAYQLTRSGGMDPMGTLTAQNDQLMAGIRNPGSGPGGWGG